MLIWPLIRVGSGGEHWTNIIGQASSWWYLSKLNITLRMTQFYVMKNYSHMLSAVSNTRHIIIHLAVTNPSELDGINLILQMRKLKQTHGKCLPRITQPLRTQAAGCQ